MNEEETNEPRILEVDGVNVIVPQCCVEGREDCKHVVQRQRPDKRNVGL